MPVFEESKDRCVLDVLCLLEWAVIPRPFREVVSQGGFRGKFRGSDQMLGSQVNFQKSSGRRRVTPQLSRYAN